ncbi:hypothetical protein C9J20_19490 [Photobacterium phosphoreum]|uniref:hypothetical protein n=1 Tax=Photobacterium phosphoreum TaxID=659 RepID=UPI000D1701D7|nr:hypothetical protein [Photobacterium phosphoreum]PSU67892.1 hypothetical protein CTM79_14700 [Photobacterium phosphoreum]PSW07871.1 hypothetical protein C9J20_19490 [Photobacterium phosphoreum]
MSAFNITYHLNDTQLHKECVFMKSLAYAKQSATAQSPQRHVVIKISDLMDNLLAERQEGKWRDHR